MAIFSAKTLYTPLDKMEDALVYVEDGSIRDVSSKKSGNIAQNKAVTDFGDCVLVPGFMDIHIHGAAGRDVMNSDRGELAVMESFLARHGVTTYLPTTVSAPLDQILTALEHLADAIEHGAKDGSGRAQPLGIHLEGPFLSHARRGVHPAEDLLTPSIRVFEEFWQAARGHLRIMTIAPELDCAAEVISEASKRGVCVSLGHSDADLESTRRGVRAGAKHATHTFNAMRPLDHREPGILGEVLTNPRLTAEVIADGVHVDPVIVNLLLRAKGVENAVLITDAMAATGMPDGRYQLGSLEIELKDGRCLSDGRLAGSVLTLDLAVRNAMKFAGWNLQQSARIASLNPARVSGAQNKGRLEAGADADFVVLTPEGEVRATVARGRLVE